MSLITNDKFRLLQTADFININTQYIVFMTKHIFNMNFSKYLWMLPIMLMLLTIASCDDDDNYTTSRNALLTFSRDSIKMDTVFTSVPSSTYSFWVYNPNEDGLRLSKVRLQRANQSGFRVNVDGEYLDNQTGSQIGGLELRGGDSLRVFVELTAFVNHSDQPQLIEDNLVFLLESGVEQKVNLSAITWDAEIINELKVERDTVISTTKPIVIRKGITIDSTATLSINGPTRLFFHADAGIDVYGRLLVNNGMGNGNGNGVGNGIVEMRGDRTDHMFDYLPYDRVSGQWQGIRIHSSSKGNIINMADIHSGSYGVICDSAAYDAITPRLTIMCSTIHNCKGPGLEATNAFVQVVNCQISNNLGDCLSVYGGGVLVLHATLAQFYPFSADRGAALRFANYRDNSDIPLRFIECYNCLVTGYEKDVVMGDSRDSTVTFSYYFSHCIMRTPEITDSLQLKAFDNVIFESPDDSIQGKQHFAIIDEDNLIYDFHLDSLSTGIGKALNLNNIFPYDHDMKMRGEPTDIGCYIFKP